MNSNDSYSIKLPEYRKAKIELFKFLSLNDLSALLTCFNNVNDDDNENSQFLNEQPKVRKLQHKQQTDDLARQNEYKTFSRLIAHQLKLDLENKKHCILIDKYFYLMKFSIENSFNKEQISCLLTILKKTHELAVDTTFGNLDETFDYFKNSLLIHAVHRPPFSLQLFTTKQLELIFDYVFSTYFKQFKFYKYVFSDAIKLNLKFTYTNKSEEMSVSALDTRLNLDDESMLSKIEEEKQRELEAEAQKVKEVQQKNELREFVRSYLANQLDKMKRDLTSEFNLVSEKNSNLKPQSASKSPKNNSKSGKKK